MKRSIIALALASTCVTTFATTRIPEIRVTTPIPTVSANLKADVNTVVKANVNTNVNVANTATGGNANVNINSQRAAASVYAPTIIHSGGADSCMGSSSGGIQGLSVGVSVGSTWKDEHCEMLRDVVRLNEVGAKETAYARMCADVKLRQAFELSGEFDCTTGKFRKVVVPAPVVIEKEVVKTVEVIKEVPVEVVREINVSSTCQVAKKPIRKSTQQKVCKG